MVELVPSILSADFSKLALEIEAAERGGGSAIHIDIMDGHFVPNLTMGPPVVKSLRKVTSLPLDCHLMIENPDDFIAEFAAAGRQLDQRPLRSLPPPAPHLAIHLPTRHATRRGHQPGDPGRFSDRNPAHGPPRAGHERQPWLRRAKNSFHFPLDKIRRLAEMRAEMGLDFRIEVDGGVAHETIGLVVEAGADLLVAGSAVFDSGQPEKEARILLKLAQDAEQRRQGQNFHPARAWRHLTLEIMQRFLFRLSTLCLLCVLPAPAQFGIFKPSKPATKPSPDNPLAGRASKQPDKELFDKAMIAMKKGKFDVARLDLQTLLNTYPESEYQMRAKLAVGDSWFKEGGTAALTQAEAEYKDFITFFPNQPEAAEAQMKVADIYYMQMEKPDRDPKNADQAEQEYRTMIQQFPDSTFVPREQNSACAKCRKCWPSGSTRSAVSTPPTRTGRPP